MSLTVYALFAAGAVLVVWYAVVLGYAWATRPRDLPAGPPTLNLGPEPPAVVNLLVTRCRMSPDAADATLLDLAARRILELHQPGPDPAELLVRVRVAAPAGLNAYEQRVFDRVAAVAGQRLTPLDHVTGRFAEGGPYWLRQLRRDVVDDARARGLVRGGPNTTALILVCVLTGMAIGCLGLLPLQRSDQSRTAGAIALASVLGWFCGSAFIGFVLILVAFAHLRQVRYSPFGRRVGTYWLGVAAWLAAHEDLADLPPAAVAIWDRYLAYGVALGVNPLASRALDLRVGHAASLTSRYTGTVRTVRVRYPFNPLAYTQAGVRLAWSAAVLAAWAGFWAFAVPAINGWPVAARIPLEALGVLLPLRAGYRLVRATIAKLAPVMVTGQVLACHEFRTRVAGTAGWLQVVLDDGRRDRTRPWVVRADLAGGARAGDVIRIRAQRWTRHVLSLQVLHRRRPRPVPPTRTAG